ncbi:M23 family metallopeptidase [Mucilaginibacter rubeus]|uniref:M23 family metallopeptidase n=1 Tax=Mucilaginibacter rubeus TaxID=2027860 RepID=UPI001AA14D2E|nr:M23 family metallopeptidase [Mucilaginibacter rubeus]QTE54662.1 M23 family metallopeptidase [Mucilaginibacter rubeus]QTF64633.1 M23 family metallopeptidase [Mucilaginibacter rubeus]
MISETPLNRNKRIHTAMAVKLFGVLLLCSLPLRQVRLTSGFGYRLHPIYHRVKLHAGIDLAARSDTVFSILDGVVQSCRYNSKLGLYVTIDHGSSLRSIYGHLSQWFVMQGDTVEAGEPIAVTGATGTVTGEHLHFGVTYRSRWLDPLKFLYQTIYPNPGP